MITIFYRKKRVNANSIEMVFSAVEQLILTHRNLHLPCEGVSIKTLCSNFLYAFQNRGKVNHVTGDAHYIVPALGRHTLLTVHDVQSALQGNFFKRVIVSLLWFIIPAMCAKKITVISEATKNDLLKLVPFAKHKISVVPNPYRKELIAEQKRDMSVTPQILHIGTKPNKNLERVLQALDGLVCELVIIGKMTQLQHKLAKKHGIRYRTMYDISFHELAKFYKSCDIVSFPSTFEGFGMPIIEANAARRPVLAGDIPVLRDVSGGSALFVDPYSTTAIRRGFEELISNGELRANLISKGEINANRFSPESIARMYNQIYKDL